MVGGRRALAAEQTSELGLARSVHDVRPVRPRARRVLVPLVRRAAVPGDRAHRAARAAGRARRDRRLAQPAARRALSGARRRRPVVPLGPLLRGARRRRESRAWHEACRRLPISPPPRPRRRAPSSCCTSCPWSATRCSSSSSTSCRSAPRLPEPARAAPAAARRCRPRPRATALDRAPPPLRRSGLFPPKEGERSRLNVQAAAPSSESDSWRAPAGAPHGGVALLDTRAGAGDGRHRE